jgi:hypothetical protein
MVSVSDNVHAVAYDAVIVKVMPRVRMANISTRVGVGTGQDVAIAGFIITGDIAKKVVIRGIGPSLARNGVPTPLANPTLTLFDGAGTKLLLTTIEGFARASNR